MTSQDQAVGGEVARNLWVRVTRALLAALLMLPFLAAFSQPANAQDADAGVAVVLQVSGLLDPLLADFVVDGIENADAEGAKVVVLQLNSTGSVISNDKLNELADVIADAEVPIAMWVGPSGARATGPWVEIAGLVDRIGVAPGSRIGNSGSERLLDDRFGDQVIELGIAPNDAPTVGDFVVSLSDLGVEISTRGEGEDARTVSDSVVRFERLSLVAGQLHTVASPPVAYLLFTIGLALLVFEFYTAGVGVAGVVGIWSLDIAGVGCGHCVDCAGHVLLLG
jgi:membrane-bound serine protease (ClpP class)